MRASILDEVDGALDRYHGMSLEMVLVGFRAWPEFVSQSGSDEYDEFGSLIYRGVPFQRSVSPNGIKFVAS